MFGHGRGLSTKLRGSRMALVALMLVWLVVVGLAVDAYRAPQWNLDGVFYTALVRIDLGRGTDSKPIYAKIKKLASPEAYRALAEGSGYRRRIRRDQAEFDLQLPFYTSKVLYRWAGAAISKSGVSPVRAPYWVTTVSFALIALLLPWWAMRAGAVPIVAYGMAGAWLTMPQIVEGVGVANPDMAGCLAFSLGVCALVGVPKPNLATAFFVAASLVRPDLCIVGIVAFLGSRGSLCTWALDGLRAGAIASAAVIATLASGAYTWPVVMRHTFLGVISKSTAKGTFGVAEYFTALRRGLAGHMTDHPAGFVPFAVAASVVIALDLSRAPADRQPLIRNLLLCVWLGIGLRFLAFPLLADRMFLPAYACTVALGAVLVSGVLKSFPKTWGRCCSPSRTTLSRHSRRIDPTNLSA